MDTYWARFINFVKDSYKKRVTEAFGGILMGFGSSQHFLFAGYMATLVTWGWWIVKIIGTLAMTFASSLLTSYASAIVKRWFEKKNPNLDPTSMENADEKRA